MARKRKRETIDDLIKDKQEQFESGRERKVDPDLDDEIWNMGSFENDAPLDERSEFEKEVPAIEEDLNEELDEKGDKAPEPAELEPEIALLRIEMGGDEMEVVCGQISKGLKKRVEKECEIERTDVADIWYDEDKMKRMSANGRYAWYNVDDVYHEIGLVGKDLDAFTIAGFINGEPIEDLDTDSVSIIKSDIHPRPKPRKDCSLVVAGTLNEGRFVYEQDIEGDFDLSKLEFVFTDLKALGIQERLLTEIRYDGEPMYYEHEVTTVKDMLDVRFITEEGGNRSASRHRGL